MPFGLATGTIDAITTALAACASFNKIILFGSRAKGNPKPGSDIDLALIGEKLTGNDLLELSLQIDRLEIAYKVDLIDYNKIDDPDLTGHIDRVGITLYEDGQFRKYGLPPVIDPESRFLILGTFPSDESLRMQQYYANPRNQFWTILSNALDEPLSNDYSRRLAMLKTHRIALWDVIESCLRKGSSDSGIRQELPNDLTQLFGKYPNLTHLLFNGNNPLIYFTRHSLDETPLVPVPPFPSTSSQYTRLTVAEKIDRWNAIRFIPNRFHP